LPLPVLPQQMAVNGCLNGRTAVDLVLSVCADVMATVVVVVAVELVDYFVSQERFFASQRQKPHVVIVDLYVISIYVVDKET